LALPGIPGKHDGHDKQNGDRPDIYQYLYYGQEISMQQQVNACHRHEQQYQAQRCFEYIAYHYYSYRRCHSQRRENIKY
jgi:hypothetical protein